MNAAASESRNDRVLVVSEMAEYMRCNERTVRRMIGDGRIKRWFRVGQEYRIRLDHLQADLMELGR